MAMGKLDSAKAIIAGFAMMALEIAGARLLYPFFGSSMIIWASIIGMFMLVLSIGYWLGAKISPRKDAEEIVGRALLLSGMFVALLPFIGDFIRYLSLPWQILLPLSALLVSLPAISLSLVSPVLIEKTDKGHAGASAGTIYAVSTVGSIAGTFIPAFFMLPVIGVAATLAAAGAMMAVLAILFMKKPSGAHAACILVALALFSGFAIAQPFGIPTYFYTAKVVDSAGARYLIMDGWAESSLNLSNHSAPVFEYAKVMAARMRSLGNVRKVAIIGAGGCTQVHHVKGIFPSATIDVVDIDAKVFDICKSRFFVNEDDGVKFHVEDGRKFLEENRGYDLIIIDVFSSGCHLPPHIGSAEFFATAARALSDNGSLMANVIVKAGGPANRAFCATVATAFEEVSCEPLGQEGKIVNLVITAGKARATPLPAVGRDIMTDDLNPIEASYGFECVPS
ncbi:MAG: fused MFS/spermidine synthase [Candidatus Micrarchaeia archaeon]